MTHRSTIFSQLLKFVPRHELGKLIKAHDGKRRRDALSRWSQFVAMATAHLAGRTSLRDIESTLDSQQSHHYHLACGAVKRSSLARANQSLSYRFYEDLFGLLYRRCRTAAPGHGGSLFKLKRKLFSLDASLLDVSLKVFPHAQVNRMKAAYKLHIGLDHEGLLPAFAAVTPGKTGDQAQARLMAFPKGSVVVFDRGYSDYGWHKQLTDKGIYWVTRLRGNAKYRVLERHPVNHDQGITSDQTIEYISQRSSRKDLPPVRRIGYYDRENKKHYVFVTNHFGWSAKTVAEIYKQRWQVELFFKWIKQNLKIKAFIGNTDNAVMTQVMSALCVYLILAFLKFQASLGQSMQQMIRLIQTNLFARRDLLLLFKPPPKTPNTSPQLNLL